MTVKNSDMIHPFARRRTQNRASTATDDCVNLDLRVRVTCQIRSASRFLLLSS